MNAQGAALEVRHQRNVMARLHAMFSGGSLLAAVLASGVNAVTSTVGVHFGVAAVILLLLSGYARTGLLADDQPGEAKEKKGRGRWTLPSRMTLWMCCAMAFGTVTEGAMNDWSALYMKDVVRASAELVPLGIAVVSGMMVLARLFADGWRSRWGDRRVVVLGSALAGGGLTLALLSGGVVPALIGFACVGLGIAAVTPCVYVAAASQGPDALTLVAAMGTTGLLVGPPGHRPHSECQQPGVGPWCRRRLGARRVPLRHTDPVDGCEGLIRALGEDNGELSAFTFGRPIEPGRPPNKPSRHVRPLRRHSGSVHREIDQCYRRTASHGVGMVGPKQPRPQDRSSTRGRPVLRSAADDAVYADARADGSSGTGLFPDCD